MTKIKIALIYGDSGRKVSRFVHLTYLVPELPDYVDQKKLKLRPLIQISFHEENVQEWISEKYVNTQRFSSVEQAKQIRRIQESGALNFDGLEVFLYGPPVEKKTEDDYLARIRNQYFTGMMKRTRRRS